MIQDCWWICTNVNINITLPFRSNGQKRGVASGYSVVLGVQKAYWIISRGERKKEKCLFKKWDFLCGYYVRESCLNAVLHCQKSQKIIVCMCSVFRMSILIVSPSFYLFVWELCTHDISTSLGCLTGPFCNILIALPNGRSKTLGFVYANRVKV